MKKLTFICLAISLGLSQNVFAGSLAQEVIERVIEFAKPRNIFVAGSKSSAKLQLNKAIMEVSIPRISPTTVQVALTSERYITATVARVLEKNGLEVTSGDTGSAYTATFRGKGAATVQPTETGSLVEIDTTNLSKKKAIDLVEAIAEALEE